MRDMSHPVKPVFQSELHFSEKELRKEKPIEEVCHTVFLYKSSSALCDENV